MASEALSDADRLKLLHRDYAKIRVLLRDYIRGHISHSGLVMEFAVLSMQHDLDWAADE